MEQINELKQKLLAKSSISSSDKELLTFALSQNVAQIGKLFLNGNISLEGSLTDEIKKDLEPIFQGALEEATALYNKSIEEKGSLKFNENNSIRSFRSFISSSSYYGEHAEFFNLIAVLQTISYFETKTKENAESNINTAALLNAIIDEDFDGLEKLNWEEINVAELVFNIISTKNEDTLGAQLSGVEGSIWFRLLQKIASINKIWAAAVITKLKPNLFYGIWGEDEWTPRVMWNGTVLIRNWHRVIGLHFEGIILLTEDELANALNDFDKINSNHKWGITAKDGQIINVQSSSDINLLGNNIVGIDHVDGLVNSILLTHDLVEKALANSRDSIAIRFFKKGIIVYSTRREDDELDFALEKLAVFSSNNVNKSAKLSSIPSKQKINGERDDSSYKAAEYEFFNSRLSQLFDEALKDSQSKDKFSINELADEKFLPFNKSLLDLLKDQLMNHTYWEVQKQFNWQQQIFDRPDERSFSYAISYHNSQDYFKLIENLEEDKNQILLYISSLDIETKNDLFGLKNYQFIYDMLENFGGDTTEARIEVFIPPTNEKEKGKWSILDSSLDEYIQRMEMLINTQLDGEWYCASDLDNEGFCIRIFFSMVSNKLINLREIGMSISEKVDNSSYPAGYVRLEVPFMGISQAFSYGEIEEGNMHE
ncbi:hypothetical protein OAN33_02480 [Flavobacteriales bacterium]|nr:hypothetical protein [Flavobacteriales bacterium]